MAYLRAELSQKSINQYTSIYKLTKKECHDDKSYYYIVINIFRFNPSLKIVQYIPVLILHKKSVNIFLYFTVGLDRLYKIRKKYRCVPNVIHIALVEILKYLVFYCWSRTSL